jgi:hypothetical protein
MQLAVPVGLLHLPAIAARDVWHDTRFLLCKSPIESADGCDCGYFVIVVVVVVAITVSIALTSLVF